MGNSKYLFLEAKKFSHLNPIFITNKKDRIKHFELNKGLKNFWIILRANYIFINGSSEDVSNVHFFGRFNIINLWHGIALKRILFDNPQNKYIKQNTIKNKILRGIVKFQNTGYKFFLSTSKKTTEQFKSAFRIKKVAALGYPRNDIFFDKKISKSDICNKYKIKDYNKIILYAPTYRGEYRNSGEMNPFSNKFLEALNKEFAIKKNLLLIKLHPSTTDLKLEKDYSNIKEASYDIEDIQEILFIADVLITDYSSIPFDFILTNKPIISYLYDFKDYTRRTPLYDDIFKEMPEPKVYNEEDLLKVLKKVNILNTSKNKDYIHFRNKYQTFKDGKSSERILRYLKLI